MRYIIIGPFPPKIGGDSRHMMDTVDYMRKFNYDFECFNISRPGKYNFHLESIKLYFKYILFIFKTYSIKNHVILNCNEGGVVKLAWPLLIFYNRKNLKLRIFGGGLMNYYNNTFLLNQFCLKITLRLFPKVFLQTKSVISEILQVIPGKEFIHLPASIHMPLFCKNVVYQNKSKLRVLFAGHLWKSKGIDFILNLSMIENSGMTFDLHGPLDDYSIDILSEYNVTYHKPYNHKMCYDVFVNYDVLLFPSTARCEGYPGVILEAMALGLPVIAFNWNGINEILDGNKGVLLDDFTLDSIYNSLKELQADLVKYRTIVKNAHNFVQKFRFEEIVKILLE